MSHVLPLPHRSTLAVPLAALALGAAGGTAAALIIADGDTVIRQTPSAQVRELPNTATPVPPRVSEAPTKSASVSSPAPVPERVAVLSPRRVVPVTSAPPVPERVTSSLAGTTDPVTAPAPERVSGAHTR
jgi:hypothetical protein